MKLDDRSQEDTDRQERCSHGDVWKLAKNVYKLKETFSPSDEWSLPAASTIKPEEREFVVDSGTSMHMVSRKDLNSARLETVKVCKNPTTVAYSQRRGAHKRRGNSVCQRIGFIRDSIASRRYSGSSITRKNSRISRVQLLLDQWSETTSHQKWQKDKLQHGELRTLRCPWSIDKLFKLIFTYISNISIAGCRTSLWSIPHQQKVIV